MGNRSMPKGRTMRWTMAALAALALAGCGQKGNPVAPVPQIPKVLVLADGGSQDSVAQILRDAGFAVTMGGLYWTYTGAGLASHDAVVFLCGTDYTHVVADSVQQKLVDFVAAGGGLLGTEWMIYNLKYNERMDRIAGILPVDDRTSESYMIESYSLAAPLHHVSAGLPDSFATTGAWSFSHTVASTDPIKQAVTIYRGSTSGDAVVVGVHGAGRTAHWNSAMQYAGADIWSPNVRRVLVNLVDYVRRR